MCCDIVEQEGGGKRKRVRGREWKTRSLLERSSQQKMDRIVGRLVELHCFQASLSEDSRRQVIPGGGRTRTAMNKLYSILKLPCLSLLCLLECISGEFGQSTWVGVGLFGPWLGIWKRFVKELNSHSVSPHDNNSQHHHHHHRNNVRKYKFGWLIDIESSVGGR